MFSFRSLELFLQPGITISTNSFVSTRREIISHLNNRHDGCVLWKHWILYLNRFTGAIVKGLNGWAAKSPKLWTRDQVRALFVHRNLEISDLRLKIKAGRSLEWSMCLLLSNIDSHFKVSQLGDHKSNACLFQAVNVNFHTQDLHFPNLQIL